MGEEKQMGYTPGPWQEIPREKIGIKNPSKRFIVAGDYADEGEPDLIVEVVAGDEVEANARLIAAAPELLEAAENVFKVYADPETDVMDLDRAINRLADVVAKAGGRQA